MQEEEAGSKLRLFTAISLPPHAHLEIADVIERLQKGARFTGSFPSWVAAESVHLTLVFLGAQDESRVPQVCDAMQKAVADLKTFRLRLSGLRLFPSAKDPRVISLGMSGDLETAKELRERLTSELRQHDFKVETRMFQPHLTLARIKSMRGLSGLRDLISSHAAVRGAEPITVDHITLYKSVLKPGGSEYTAMHKAMLRS